MTAKTNQPEKKEKELPARYRQLLSVIPYGRANAMTVKNIIKLIGGKDTHIREDIHYLVVKHGYKIGSWQHGFYIIETDEEKRHAVANLLSRVKHIAARAAALQKEPGDPDQLTIDNLYGDGGEFFEG